MSRIRQRYPFTDSLVSKALSYQNSANLGQTIQGIHFPNPVGLAAGFDKNIELAPTMKAVGYGFMTGGSVTFLACEGNPRPWFYRLPKQKSLVVNVGLANEGTQAVMDRLRTYKQSLFDRFPLVVSVAKTNSPDANDDPSAIADYVGSLSLLQNQPQVSVIEVNISCPNAFGGEPFTDPQRLEQLLANIDALNIAKPVWVKMPIDLAWPAFNELLNVIVRHNVHGVTIGNLQKSRSEIPSEDLPNEVKGNLSGLPTQAPSDELIRLTYASYGSRLMIVGVGGIFTAQDAYRKICLGASLVELITGMIYEGPQLVGQINRELVDLLKRDNFSTIGEAIGSAHTKQP
jgi:dihydroorotate dehydrogenase (fumarate)